MATNLVENEDIRIHVRERYGKLADKSAESQAASCCGPTDSTTSCCGPEADVGIDQIAVLYDQAPDAAELPDEITNLSLGCGDPVTLASLKPGQTVVDLGSGGGIDCFLAAKRVGQTGRVIGVDMTPQMLEKARANKVKVGADNVEFRLGEIEHLPVADNTADVIISNCVINLSPDKAAVFHEAFRVLKPGGRLAVTDIVTDGPLPENIKKDLSAWAECVGGALDVTDYVLAIKAAGFADVEVEPVYFDSDLVEQAVVQLDLGDAAKQQKGAVQQLIFSAKITAQKPTKTRA